MEPYSSAIFVLSVTRWNTDTAALVTIGLTRSTVQYLVTACEKILLALDMSLNAGKSCCMRIGSRYDKPCANVLRMMVVSYHGLRSYAI